MAGRGSRHGDARHVIATAVDAIFVGALSYSLAEAARRWAIRRDLLDRPNARSSHSIPTPRTGGIAIVLGAAIGLVILAAIGPWRVDRPHAAAAAAGLFVAAMGAVEDVRSLPMPVRLAAHAVAAMFVIAVHFAAAASTATIGISSVVGIALSMIWLVGLTNAYNFMDGIDGIAATQAIVSGLAWSIVASQAGDYTIAAAGLLIAAACAGFLAHNWMPARLFMGDAGSTALGFALGVFPILIDRPGYWLAGVLIAWPFVFDATWTFVLRLVAGENVFSAHHSHIYQRLVEHGWPHQRVTAIYSALAGVAASTAVGVVRAGGTLQAQFRLSLLVTTMISAAMLMLFRLAMGPGARKTNDERVLWP
jgi:glycosyltransferase WbpL